MLPPSPFAAPIRRRQAGRTQSTRYWFKDGSVVLLVQNTLYKVHKSILSRTGDRFGDIFAAPLPGGGLGTEEDPMVLNEPGVTSQAFDALMSAIYVSLPAPTFRTAELIHILRLSALFRCPSLRMYAIEMLTAPHHARAISPLEFLRLAKDCDVPEWVIPPLVEFARLRTPIPVELGAELISRIAQARDVLVARRIALILEGEIDLDRDLEFRSALNISDSGGLAPIEEEHDTCGDVVRRELTRLHALPAEDAPFPPESLLRALPQLRGELCPRCRSMAMAELELRVRDWLDLEGDVAAVEGVLLGMSPGKVAV